MSNDVLDMNASASAGDYKKSASAWNRAAAPQIGADADSDKRVIRSDISVSIENGTLLFSAKYSSKDGEWKSSDITQQVKKDLSAVVDGVRSGYLNVNTGTIKGAIKDYQTIRDIKNNGFGVDGSEKPEKKVLGNARLKEVSEEDCRKYEGENPEAGHNKALL